MDEPDWTLSTWRGNRLQQHREFQKLSFREKLLRLEQLAATAAMLQRSRSQQQPDKDSASK